MTDSRLIAVLIACHERPAVTKACLDALAACHVPAGYEVSVIAVDSSRDARTAAVLAASTMRIRRIAADADTYWAEAMHLAWQQARACSPGYYLWLNDDVELSQDALAVLIDTYLRKPGVVGSRMKTRTGQVSYGGYLRGPWYRRLDFIPATTSARAWQDVDCLNGNLLFVSRYVDELLGGFPRHYRHGMADFAYTLGARRRGLPVSLTDDALGLCEANPTPHGFRQGSLVQRLSAVVSPKAFPVSDWFRFCFTYGGLAAPAYALLPYVKAVFRK